MEIILKIKSIPKVKIENLPNEIWKDIPNYEGIYQISNKGRIKSLARIVGTCKRKEKLVIPFDNGRGYLTVALHKDNKGIKHYVHRLVAQAFIKNIDNKNCVNHKDHNRKNNDVDNLEWVTYKENNNYSHCAENAALKKSLRVLLIDLDSNPVKMFASIHQCANYFNVSPSAISAAINNCYTVKKQYKVYSAYNENDFDIDESKLKELINDLNEAY